MDKKSRKLRMGVSFLILFCAFIYSKNSAEINNYISKIIPINYTYAYSIENIPEYTDKEYIIMNHILLRKIILKHHLKNIVI